MFICIDPGLFIYYLSFTLFIYKLSWIIWKLPGKLLQGHTVTILDISISKKEIKVQNLKKNKKTLP